MSTHRGYDIDPLRRGYLQMRTDPFLIDKTSRAKFVFLFAHPDDEVFISGAMRRLLDVGARVDAVWATSGDYFSSAYKREAEHATAMSIIGLDQKRIHLMRLPDLGLIANLNNLAKELARILQDLLPDYIFANAYEGGHPDHDCVNFAAFEATRRASINPVICEFPLYNGAGHFYHWWWKINSFPTDEPPFTHIPLNKKAVMVKYAMMKAYSTQWMYMAPARLASPRWKLYGLGEPYRVCPSDRDHTVRPHSGRLNYERWFNFFMRLKFNNYREAVIDAMGKA